MLPPTAREAIADCDAIPCVSGIIGENTLAALMAIAPAAAIHGNIDDNRHIRQELPLRIEDEFGDVRYLMMHKPKNARPVPDGIQLVVCGHMQMRFNEVHDGVRWVNPSTIRHNHEECVPELALLDADDGTVGALAFVSLSSR